MSDITALSALSVDKGEMSPRFDPATYMYYVLLREDQLGKGRVLDISATPNTPAAKVYVGGHPVDWRGRLYHPRTRILAHFHPDLNLE